MAKFLLIDEETGEYQFFCPGCNYSHSITTLKPNNRNAQWEFNGDVDKPTVSPSIMVNGDHTDDRCHSFVENGMIRFLSDCFHDLKGSTVEIPECES